MIDIECEVPQYVRGVMYIGKLIGLNCPGVIMIGEIDGADEEKAAEFTKNHVQKPVTAISPSPPPTSGRHHDPRPEHLSRAPAHPVA